MDDEKALFTALDPRGYTVILSSNRYYMHIISQDSGHNPHIEFTPEEIKASIETPDVIYGSSKPNSDIYFAKSCSSHPDYFLKTAVVTYDADMTGEVRTAFLTKHISGGIDGEELKYVKSKL